MNFYVSIASNSARVFFVDNIVLEYRDPIIGVILLVFIVFLISFFTYSYGIYKEKKARKDYRKLSKRFELGKLKEDDYVNLYKTYNLPFDSILLLANTFLHKGDNNKAISVYLELLELVNDRVKKEELLELLGTTYFKGGFLQRADDIFLQILKFSPRNKNALRNLVLIHEKLKNYKKAREILNSLEELNVDVSLEKIYFDSLVIINDPILSVEKRTAILYEIFEQDRSIQRVFVNFLLQFNKEFFYNHLKEFNSKQLIDILWFQKYEDINFNKIRKNSFISQIYAAKGYIKDIEQSEDFNLDILILINKSDKKINASLNFEFICKKCKHSFIFYESRCPNCQEILSLNVKHHLAQNHFIQNQSLQ